MASVRAIGVAFVALALLAAACSTSSVPEAPVTDPPPAAESASTLDTAAPSEPELPTTAQPEASPEPPAPTVDLQDPAERATAEAVLVSGIGPDDAPIAVSDRPFDAGTRFVLGAWAVVVSQRHDVFELSLDLLRDALSGVVDDWEKLGGREQPLNVLLASDQALALQWSLGVSLGDAVQLLEAEALVAAAQTTPGALAVADLDQLEPGLLPLVIDGWDPLRDPADESPLTEACCIEAGTVSANRAWAEQLGWQEPSEINPLGLHRGWGFHPSSLRGERRPVPGGR